MELFVGNIGSQASSGQIKRFFAQYAQKASKWRCNILRARNPQQDRTVYFAHIILEPEHLALAAIKHLNQQKLNGKTLLVRKYVQRSAHGRPKRSTHQKPGVIAWFSKLLGQSGSKSAAWDGRNRRCMTELENAEVQSFMKSAHETEKVAR